MMLGLAAIVLIWAVAVPVGPDVCRLDFPGPRNCFVADRTSAGIVWTVIVGVISAAMLLVSIVAQRRRRLLVILGAVALVITVGASYLAVAWIPSLA